MPSYYRHIVDRILFNTSCSFFAWSSVTVMDIVGFQHEQNIQLPRGLSRNNVCHMTINFYKRFLRVTDCL